MKANAISATPSTLNATCRTNHAFRPAEGSAPAASPLRLATPTRPVASGPAKNAPAEPRSSRSLTSCNRTRHSASIEMAGPRPIGVSCETATTWTAAPAQGTAIVSARGAAGRPKNGANASTVVKPYSARAMRCRVTITTGTRSRARARGPGRASGRHLLDQPNRKTHVETGMDDLDQKSRRRMVAGVNDHHHGAHFLRCRAQGPGRRPIDLEHIARRHAVGASLVDEEVLLRTGDGMRIARLQQLPEEALLDRRGTHPSRIAERLERHRQIAVMNAAELRDDAREHLFVFQGGHASDSDRHDDIPPAARCGPIDARQQQRITDVVRGVTRRFDGNVLERRRAGAVRQAMDRGYRGGTEDPCPRQALVLAEETGGVKLTGTQRPIRLVGIGAQNILHLLAIGAAAIEYRLVGLGHRWRWRLDHELRRVGRHRVRERGRGIDRHDRDDRVARSGTHGVGSGARRILRNGDDRIAALRDRNKA